MAHGGETRMREARSSYLAEVIPLVPREVDRGGDQPRTEDRGGDQPRTEDRGGDQPRTEDREALVRGLIAGDRAATAAFFDRYQRRINRLVWRLLGADPEHDDVVHQAFLQILRSIGRLKSPGALDEWVNQVVINTVRKEIRSRRYRRRVIVAVEEVPERPGGDHGPADRLLALRFYQALGRLGAEERIVLVLRFVEQHTLEEIARMNRYSLATTKRRLARAVRAFKKIVGADPLLASVIEGSR
jgi:RNA polymerase sigma-70 factor (ECF subfamily)